MPATITFADDAYESAVAFFTLLGRRPQDAKIVPGVGYMVRIYVGGDEPFEAEVIGITEIERDDCTYDAVRVQPTGGLPERVLAIYDDIDRIEVL